MAVELKNFLPTYPNISDSAFNEKILRKKEFIELKVDRPKVGKDILLNYQRLISRFLSSYTPYDELLLFHEMGTGKTCTAIGAVEKLRYETNTFVNGAVILAKGDNVLNNFVGEYLYKCTGDKYLIEGGDERAMRREMMKFYKLNTFEKFAKHVASSTNDTLCRLYENKVFVLDEIQNIRDKDYAEMSSVQVYKSMHRLFHLLKRRKIILMSGTPMKDNVDEFADVMNLILPADKQFIVGPDFKSRYFDDNDKLTLHVDEFKAKIRGRISYLKAGESSTVRRVFIGRRNVGDLRYFKLFLTTMSDMQTASYREAYALDTEAGRGGIFNNSRQAILAIYPDGTYGAAGFKRYLVDGRRASMELRAFLTRYGDDDASKLRALQELSCKYAYIVERLLDKENKTFVYSEFVNGSGSLYLTAILDAFNFIEADGYERTVRRRYALINNQTSTSRDVKRIVARFNDVTDNVRGDVIRVLIGSKMIIEGITLHDIVDEHILTPHWNYAETAQAIARGWRYRSHDALIAATGGGENIVVNVFQHASVESSNNNNTSIDVRMYEIAERKDVLVKELEYIVKVSNWDCALNRERNYIQSGVDGERECEYEKCDYQCDVSMNDDDINIVDDSTYNLYYGKNAEIAAELREYFKTRSWASLQIDVLPFLEDRYDEFEILNTISTMIRDNDVFRDAYDFERCLRFCGDVLYATTDLRYSDDINVLYYNMNRFVYAKGGGGDDAFPQLVDAIYDHVYEKLKSSIIDYPADIAIRTMRSFDIRTQRRILSDFVISDPEEQRVASVRRVLDAYAQFYGIVDDGIVVWVYSDQLNGTALRFDADGWNEIEYTPPKTTSKFATDDVEFYGQVNPSNDEFCIRDLRGVDRSSNVRDLRFLKVGKRCRDWEFSNLIEIVVFHLRIIPPSPTQKKKKEETTSEIFESAVKKNGKFFERFPTIKPADMTDDERRAFVYWVTKDRRDICQAIRRELDARNLIEDNLECGGQKKRRLKYE